MLNAERFPKRAWSAEDMSLLRTQFVQGKSVVDIARDMKRSTASVNTRITKMDLRRGSGSSVQRWSDEDVHAMEHHYRSGCSDKVIAEKLSFQVSWEAVKRKRERLGLTSWRFPTVQTPWSDADLDELRALAASQLPVIEIVARLTRKRTTAATRRKLMELGLKDTDPKPRTPWTDADISTLHTLHGSGLTLEAIRDALSTFQSVIAVRQKLTYLHLSHVVDKTAKTPKL